MYSIISIATSIHIDRIAISSLHSWYSCSRFPEDPFIEEHRCLGLDVKKIVIVLFLTLKITNELFYWVVGLFDTSINYFNQLIVNPHCGWQLYCSASSLRKLLDHISHILHLSCTWALFVDHLQYCISSDMTFVTYW